MTKLIVAFRNSANAPEKESYIVTGIVVQIKTFRGTEHCGLEFIFCSGKCRLEYCPD